MKEGVCCCGHRQGLHRDHGSCRVCGGLSCPRFHAVGEGHASPVLLMIAFALAAALLWQFVYGARDTRPWAPYQHEFGLDLK